MNSQKKLKYCLMLVASFLLSTVQLYAGMQQDSNKATGTVVDEKGEVLIGVSVQVKGASTGTITDVDGNFSLDAPSGATLAFSYIGYTDVEVKAARGMKVTMVEAEGQLDEVVVVGYGTMKKKDLTGGLAVVGEKELGMVSTSNLMDRLVGQVPGLSITTSNAAPGAEQSILIRGQNSLNAENDPLIVLDGIPYRGALVDLDPNIIESLSILKDASAVAIYGSRGSNGVILIQTKRGAIGKPQVSYKAQFGLAEPMQRIQVMGPNEYIRFKQDIGRLDKGYTADELDPIAGSIISNSEKANYLNGTTHDWQDYMFQTGFTMDHQVAITGGTDQTKYMAAIAYLDQEGVVYNSKLTRTNISVNVDQTFNKWLTIGMGTQFVQKENGGITPTIEHGIKQSPYGQYKDEAGYYVSAPMEYERYGNPMRNVNADQDKTSRNFFLNAYANILLPIKGLSFRTNYGYNYRSGFTGTYYGRDTFDGKETENEIGGKASISNNHYTDYTWENVLRYEQTIGNHRFDATGLFSMQESEDKTSSQSGDGFVTDDVGYNMINTAERNQKVSSGYSHKSVLSYMLRLNYAYQGKYMATLTGRSDGAPYSGKTINMHFFHQQL